ncbi:hypothetical protein JL722_15107 [Aureococcus anophagefferens]|nr:hypothetical protein JL722_15107 [Aureococcus anophagefferens]
MSATVVGSALLAALLVLPMESLENMGLASETAAKKAKKGAEEAEDEAGRRQGVGHGAPRCPWALDDVASPLFEAGTPVTYGALRHAGIRTMRRCICESRNSNSDARILRCEKSGHTACENCAGKPEHYFAPDDTPRSEPRAFEKALAGPAGSKRGGDVYFFLESEPVGKPENDGYVFALDWRKLKLSAARPSSRLDVKWKPPVAGDGVNFKKAELSRSVDAVAPVCRPRAREGDTVLEWRVVPGEPTFQRERAPNRPFGLTSNRGDWPSELKKFLGGSAAKKYNVITIATMLDLKKLTVAKMLAADIVFVAVSAFRTDAFYDHLAEFAAVHKLPKKGGRHFQEVHAKAIANVERYVGCSRPRARRARKARKADKARRGHHRRQHVEEAGLQGRGALRGAREKTAAPKKKKAEKPDEPMPGAADDDEPMDDEDSESEEEEVKKPKKDAWKKLQAPPLQLFHFARKVVDEYTFDDVKSIAAFLGVHLGAADPVQLTKKGTAFVNRFVRQNVAEIDEIPFVEHVRKVDLPSAERAVYLELEHHLRALEMQTSKHAGRGRAGSARSDREARLREALRLQRRRRGAAQALRVLDARRRRQGAPATVVGACDVVARREAELDECASQIRREVAAAYRLGELRRWGAARP